MAYAMMSIYGRNGLMISAAAAFLRGYRRENPLTALEREVLPILVACRLACSATLGAYSYQQNPENDYLLLHAEPAWRALELLWPLDSTRRGNMTTAIRRVWDRACDAKVVIEDNVIRAHDLVVPDPTLPDLMHDVRVKDDGGELPHKKARI